MSSPARRAGSAPRRSPVLRRDGATVIAADIAAGRRPATRRCGCGELAPAGRAAGARRRVAQRSRSHPPGPHRRSPGEPTFIASWRSTHSVRCTASRRRRAGCRRGASIVNICSLAALTGHYTAAYTASKWALRGLSRAASMELGPRGIRVNAVFPGYIETAMTASAPAAFLDASIQAAALGSRGPARGGGRVVRLAALRRRLLCHRRRDLDRRRHLGPRRRQVSLRRGATRGDVVTLAGDLGSARVRRIVTGHDASGRAVIVEDRRMSGAGLAEDTGRAEATFFQLWATHEMPVSLTDDAMDAPARRKHDHDPRNRRRIGAAHRRPRARVRGRRCTVPKASTTESVWRASATWSWTAAKWSPSARVTSSSNAGTNHVWHNRSDAACRFAWILLDARPVEINGQRLGASWRHEPAPGETT